MVRMDAKTALHTGKLACSSLPSSWVLGGMKGSSLLAPATIPLPYALVPESCCATDQPWRVDEIYFLPDEWGCYGVAVPGQVAMEPVVQHFDPNTLLMIFASANQPWSC